MPHDFNKPSHVQTPEERQKKKRVPLYILALVGIFLIALLFYMFADTKPNPKPNPNEAPPGHPNPSAEPATPNNSTTATAGDEATANDSNTATATDR